MAAASPSPPPMMRTASSEGAVELQHPKADLQSLQGAYAQNIERLEEHAERLSSGSDIGEEIRKLQLQQKRSESTASSTRSSRVEESRAFPLSRSRNVSTSSYSNSIVDTNIAARHGGYSPSGYIYSPVASVRSGSWSQPSRISSHRPRSVSKGSQLSQSASLDLETEATPYDPPIACPSVRESSTPEPVTHSSFSRQYDEIAQDINRQLDQIPVEDGVDPDRNHLEEQDAHNQSPTDLPDRPSSAASGDTFQQARTLFRDFDGVHCMPSIGGSIRESMRQPSNESDGMRSHHSSMMLHDLPQPDIYGEPPPGEDMVYYPAPVPRTLNLPKRLSQLPSTAVQAKRRTQILSSIPTEARKSAAWLTGYDPNFNLSQADLSSNRKNVDPSQSMLDLAGLPPQLRASVFFDHQSVPQAVEVKGQSAMDTLDYILEASASAPASVFTDHPFTGQGGETVYAKEEARKSTTTLLDTNRSEVRKSRSSLDLLLGRRSISSTDQLTGGGAKLQKRNSRMSLGTQLNEDTEAGADNAAQNEEEELEHVGETTPFRPQEGDNEQHAGDEDAEPEAEPAQHESEEPEFFTQPTTLLAELQLRKQQQRMRNRTAATAFPNGMHSTLLELDAVAQVEKKRRMGHRVALAWEDPNVKAAEEAAEDDEDVPLGMLFPARNGLINRKQGQGQAPGLSDWDRPLGLIAQRELDDNEPLSSRRNRLRGVDPARRTPSPAKRPAGTPAGPTPSPQQIHLAGQPNAAETQAGDHDEDEEETLAQRIRRLKNREALDNTIVHVESRPVGRALSHEIMSQLGGLDTDKNDVKNGKPTATGADADADADEEEETLAQRRARLQRSGQAQAQVRPHSRDISGNGLTVPGARPPLKPSRSMADILPAHPAGNAARKISNHALVAHLPQGSLLQQNERAQARHRQQMVETNKRSSSYGFDSRVMVDGVQVADGFAAGRQGAIRVGAIGGASAATTPGIGLSVGAAVGTPMGIGFDGNGYFGNAMAYPQQIGMGVNGVGSMSGFGTYGFPSPMGFPQQTGMNGMMNGMGGMSGFMSTNGAYAFPQQNVAAAMMQAQPQQPVVGVDMAMDSGQRDLIDRWRQSIMQ